MCVVYTLYCIVCTMRATTNQTDNIVFKPTNQDTNLTWKKCINLLVVIQKTLHLMIYGIFKWFLWLQLIRRAQKMYDLALCTILHCQSLKSWFEDSAIYFQKKVAHLCGIVCKYTYEIEFQVIQFGIYYLWKVLENYCTYFDQWKK